MLTGGGASGARPISRLQQTDPARAEHDTEGRGRLRSGFHSAHQCGKIFLYMGGIRGRYLKKLENFCPTFEWKFDWKLAHRCLWILHLLFALLFCFKFV